MTARYPMLLTEAERDLILRQRMETPGRMSIREMVRLASNDTGIPMADLLGPSRKAKLCRIREAVYLTARKRGYSLPQIGRVFHRDHTSILQGIRNIEQRACNR